MILYICRYIQYYIFVGIYIYDMIYIYNMSVYMILRIECRLRNTVHSHIMQPSRIQRQGVRQLAPLAQDHCSTGRKYRYAEAATRVPSSLKTTTSRPNIST